MIPTNIITGSLGAGKTTIILNLIQQLPQDYKVIWLKNEYGDVNIDSELAKLSNIQTEEVLNGCLCCVLIGKLHDAVVEIVETYSPDRLIIETAGTAYPYPIVKEINEIEQVALDSLVTVVDAKNYEKFVDTSPLAKKQSKYVDLVVINKTQLVDDDDLYHVIEDVNDLYYKVPQVRTADGFVSKDVMIGLDAKLANAFVAELEAEHAHDDEHHHHDHAHPDAVEAFSFVYEQSDCFDLQKFREVLETLDRKNYYRIKGIVQAQNGFHLVNYVVGDIELRKLDGYKGEGKLTFMGKGVGNEEERVERMLLNALLGNDTAS